VKERLLNRVIQHITNHFVSPVLLVKKEKQ